MAKSPVDTSMKYKVRIKFAIRGVVGRDDILGAIYGQLEPVLPRELYHRVQDKNRKDVVFHIHINGTEGGITRGVVELYSRLDRYETAIIAAAIELIEKVAAYPAEFRVESFENMLRQFIDQIKNRAAELIATFESDELLEQSLRTLKEDVKKLVDEITSKKQIIEYGEDKLPAGPDVDKSDEIIIVEGKNDVLALLKAGYKNVIAMKGAEIPKTLDKLAKGKSRVIAFLDNDSQGIKNLLTLMTRIRVDYVALPPENKREVEELTPSEIRAALSKENLLTPEEAKALLMRHDPRISHAKKFLDELQRLGREEFAAMDADGRVLAKTRNLEEALQHKPFALVYNGPLDQTHINAMVRSGHVPRLVVANEGGEIVFRPANMAIVVKKALRVFARELEYDLFKLPLGLGLPATLEPP